MDLNKAKNEKGITLIALAVTIVVLLILAGVTISSVFSENGIIERAKKAQNTIEKAEAEDIAEIENLSNYMEQYLNGSLNIKEDDYTTLSFQTYIGKYQRQVADYLKFKIEISDFNNEEDKVIFNIGTDWKDKIEINDNNKLYYISKNNSDITNVEMLQVIENDGQYNADDEGISMSKTAATGFTDVKLTLKVKKDYDYTIKVYGQGAIISSGDVTITTVEIYSGTTGKIENVERNIKLEKNDVFQTVRRMFDFDGDTVHNSTDAAYLSSFYNSAMGNSSLKTYIFDDEKKGMILMNEYGTGAIEEKYIALDVNRDGIINKDDENLIVKMSIYSY